MNVSVVTPNTAGIESTAKITSAVSMATSTASSGVAMSRPPPGQEPRAVIFLGHRDDPAQAAPGQPAGRAGMAAATHHPDRRDQQERAEQVERPAEPLDQGGPGGDEEAAQHERAEHAGEQYPALVGGGHRERLEQQGEHEDVVDAQCLLDQIGGEVLAAGLPAPAQHHDQAEPGARRQPGRADQHGPPHPGLPPVGQQVGGEQHDEHAPGGRPGPAWGGRHRSSRRCRCEEARRLSSR